MMKQKIYEYFKTTQSRDFIFSKELDWLKKQGLNEIFIK